MRLFAAPLLFAALLAAPAIQAQGSDAIVGKWAIEFERGRSIENGEVKPIMGKGTLLVIKDGSGFKGTLEAGPRPDGSATPASVMPGEVVAGGGVVFHQTSKAQMNMNGDVKEVEIKSTWTLLPKGDALSGELIRMMPNMPEAGGATQVTGTRVK